MGLVGALVTYIAPVFLITSPLTSYADQIRNIHVTKSSRGFSLDTPLIMLVASILRCFYWLGADFETSLLIQSIIMIVVQLCLLKVALDNRPAQSYDDKTPFSAVVSDNSTRIWRPYGFWMWKNQRPYWEFLLYFVMTTTVLQLFFGNSQFFVDLLGYVGLGVEATLPIPQVLANQRSRSCTGFRLSVLASWLAGDVMKMVFFAHAEHVGLQFRLCAFVQFALDIYLGIQFWMFGAKEKGVVGPEVEGKF